MLTGQWCLRLLQRRLVARQAVRHSQFCGLKLLIEQGQLLLRHKSRGVLARGSPGQIVWQEVYLSLLVQYFPVLVEHRRRQPRFRFKLLC